MSRPLGLVGKAYVPLLVVMGLILLNALNVGFVPVPWATISAYVVGAINGYALAMTVLR